MGCCVTLGPLLSGQVDAWLSDASEWSSTGLAVPPLGSFRIIIYLHSTLRHGHAASACNFKHGKQPVAFLVSAVQTHRANRRTHRRHLT